MAISAMMSGRRSDNNNALWWESLDDECPITLEPLSSLPYPPFLLSSNYFDGYMVSRCMFENPLTREPLTYSDCKRLDDYIRTFHKQDTRMAVCCEAFTLSSSVKVKSDNHYGDNDDRRARVLRSEAAAALCHLFVYGRHSHVSEQAAWNVAEPQRQQAHSFNLYNRPTRSAVDAMDGLCIIDDDEARVVLSEQQDWTQVQQAFPPISSSNVGNAPSVGVDQRLLQTVKKTAAQTRQEEDSRRKLLKRPRYE